MKQPAGALILGILLCGACLADELVLKDGTTLEGRVLKQGDVYWIRLTDGQTRLVPAGDVKSHLSGDTPPSPKPTPVGTSADLAALRRKADEVNAPLAAIAMWEKFLDANPSVADAAAARIELEKWKKLHDDGAEKINGKWVGGEQRKAIIARADALLREAMAVSSKQTLLAIQKLEEAAKIYPNSHRVNFTLGYLYIQARSPGQAMKYFEQGLQLCPDAADAMNNLAVARTLNNDFAGALELFYKAAVIQDSPQLAQNLINALALTPPAKRDSAQNRKIIEAAQLLARKYAIRAPTPNFSLMPPGAVQNSPERVLPPGVRSSGTGFVIRDDGLILTNRHVVENASSLLVLLPGNIRKNAEVVKIDDSQDLAIVRIRSGDRLPVARLSPVDLPPEGAQCYAIGYPLLDRIGASMKITQGIVSGLSRTAPADIITDAKVNPGNSGGPLLDSHGLVIGIVSMKSLSSATEDSYGMAISAGRIRKFLAENKLDLPPGAPAAQPLNAEQVVAALKPATVCIISMR